jgi:hypothetical protein
LSPARARELLRAVAANAAACPLWPHQREAITASGFPHLLTPGELWFLDCVRRLRSLSERQQARLNEIAVKVERGRR